MKPLVAYSALLLEFIEPINADVNTEESVYERCRMGMTISNYYVSRKYKLQMFEAVKHVVDNANAESPDFKAVFDFLLQRKAEYFDQHNNIILNVERRIKPDGSSTIYVESAPHHIIAQTDVSSAVNKIVNGQ